MIFFHLLTDACTVFKSIWRQRQDLNKCTDLNNTMSTIIINQTINGLEHYIQKGNKLEA